MLHPQISVYGKLKILSWYCWDGMDISYKNNKIYNYMMVVIRLYFNIGEGFLKMSSHIYHSFFPWKMPFSKHSEWRRVSSWLCSIQGGTGMLNCCCLVTVVWSELDFNVSRLNSLLYIAKLYWYMRSLEHNIQSAITILCNITASSQRQYYCTT